MMNEQDPQIPLIENEDFYWDERGLMVLTEAYLKKRGYCCEQGCRHCPYGFDPEENHSPQG